MLSSHENKPYRDIMLFGCYFSVILNSTTSRLMGSMIICWDSHELLKSFVDAELSLICKKNVSNVSQGIGLIRALKVGSTQCCVHCMDCIVSFWELSDMVPCILKQYGSMDVFQLWDMACFVRGTSFSTDKVWRKHSRVAGWAQCRAYHASCQS